MDTLENLQGKLAGAQDLKSVVRTMKAIAASNIGQYDLALDSLGDYYHTIALGIAAYLRENKINFLTINQNQQRNNPKIIYAIVFGSDQGLVGRFNDSMADFVSKSLKIFPEKKEVWAVGERVQLLLSDFGFTVSKLFTVPNSIQAVTPLVGEILIRSEEVNEHASGSTFYIFYNQLKPGAGYEPIMLKLLPLDEKWKNKIAELPWPTKNLPQILDDSKSTLIALIHEYLFISLFNACVESLASENTSRLEAMTRAEKNIDDLLNDLNNNFHQLRQNSIDEELFDVISGFEALKRDTKER